MESAAFDAAIPAPVTVLGVQLLPLSLGRYRLLHRFECSFVADGEATATIPDLLVGILICSMPCAEFVQAIEANPRALRRQLVKWGKRIRREAKHDRHFSIFEKYALFRHYVRQASKVPSFWIEHPNDAPSPSHWSVAVEVALRANLGYTAEEILEAPLSKALEDYFKWSEMQGAIRLISEEEQTEIDAQAAHNAKIFEQLVKDHPELATKESN